MDRVYAMLCLVLLGFVAWALWETGLHPLCLGYSLSLGYIYYRFRPE